MAKKFGYSDFEAWLTTGGDDRSLILDSGANKYHIRPTPIKETDIFRGSCTGNPPTTRGYEAAKTLYESRFLGLTTKELDLALRITFDEQRKRIMKCLDLPHGSEIILCPSGSDAEYIPVAIATALHPGQKLVNGISQLNEIGAGSEPASIGKYFSTHAPFLGKHDMINLPGFEDIQNFVIPAREPDGTVVNASKLMDDFVNTEIKNGNFPIVHGVFGGKTGVRDSIMPGSLNQGNTSLGIVDACQGRFTLDELKRWLNQDSIVLFTSSKFYQAPPFCGAVIIPHSIANRLRTATRPEKMLNAESLGAFLTDKELPSCLHSWGKPIQDSSKNNLGLALRWEAGLAAMEALLPIKDVERTRIADEWGTSVKNLVDDSELLDTFCVERSIVSIRISNKKGGWLNMSEARNLYRWMSNDIASAVVSAAAEDGKILSTSCYIGQPVSVSDSYAIIRIALGAESMMSYYQNKTMTLEEDSIVVKKLGLIAKHFDELKESGV